MENESEPAIDLVNCYFLHKTPAFRQSIPSIRRPSSGDAHRNLHRGPLVDKEPADQVWEAWDKGAKDNVLSTKIEFVIL